MLWCIVQINGTGELPEKDHTELEASANRSSANYLAGSLSDRIGRKSALLSAGSRHCQCRS